MRVCRVGGPGGDAEFGEDGRQFQRWTDAPAMWSHLTQDPRVAADPGWSEFIGALLGRCRGPTKVRTEGQTHHDKLNPPHPRGVDLPEPQSGNRLHHRGATPARSDGSASERGPHAGGPSAAVVATVAEHADRFGS